jgi:hypothetical protein
VTEPTSSESDDSGRVPAGWYAVDNLNERYWGGQAWTEEIRPIAAEPILVEDDHKKKRSWWGAIGVFALTWIAASTALGIVGGGIALSRRVSLPLSYPDLDSVATPLSFGVCCLVAFLYLQQKPKTDRIAIGLIVLVCALGGASGFLPKTLRQDAFYLAQELSSQYSPSELRYFCSDPNAISILQQRGVLTADDVAVWTEAKKMACAP